MQRGRRDVGPHPTGVPSLRHHPWPGKLSLVPVIAPRGLAQLVKEAGVSDPDTQVNLVAVAISESNGELSAVVGNRRGPWLLNDSRGYDRTKMVTDAAYAARAAVAASSGGQRMDIWPSWVSGAYKVNINAGRQAVAQAAAVSGSVLSPAGTYVPASVTTPPPLSAYPVVAGAGRPLASAAPSYGPLRGLRIIGTALTGDFSSSIIGAPHYEAGWTTIPNLKFTIADPEGDLLWRQGNLWQRGARVQYLDLDMRIDEIVFEPGSHTTGQLTITAIDAIVYAMQLLRGARTGKASVANWLAQEMSLCGFDPSRYLLAEQGPTQAIARDVPDQAGQTGSGEIPSSWTTAVRLGKETGKRIFVSGRKLIYGSAEFCMAWAAPGDLDLAYHTSNPAVRWLNLPSAKRSSVGDRQGVLEATGQVPFNRAQYFRPGASVIVHNTPAIAAGNVQMVCSDVSYDLGVDVDGADITLIQPVNLTPEPPSSTTTTTK